MKTFLSTIAFFFCLTKLYAGVIVQNGLTHVHQLGAGQQVSGKIVLKNIGNSSERVVIYQKDYQLNCSGTVGYLEPGSNPRSLSSYLKVSNADYNLAAGETYELTYKIDIPTSFDIKGSLWSLLMIEITEPLTEQQVRGNVTVGSKVRYGVQIIASTPETEPTEVKFTDVKIEKNGDGQKIVNVTIENKGVLFAKPHIELQLFNSNAEIVGEFKSVAKKVYPGNCQLYSIPLSEFPPGTYKAIMIADYDNSAVAVNLTIQY